MVHRDGDAHETPASAANDDRSRVGDREKTGAGPASGAAGTPSPAPVLTGGRPGFDRFRPAGPGADSGVRRLVVGRGISVAGRIGGCDRLLVEGRVETGLHDGAALEIAPSGVFKGGAEVETADIGGLFEGSLTARRALVVRAGGRVRGSVRYGELAVERGATIAGEMRYDPGGSAAGPR